MCKLIRLNLHIDLFQREFLRAQYLGPCCFWFTHQAYQARYNRALFSATNFTDDTCLLSVNERSFFAAKHLQDSVTNTGKWLESWKLAVNLERTLILNVHRRNFPTKFEIIVNDKPLKMRHLTVIIIGTKIVSDLRRKHHVDNVICERVSFSYFLCDCGNR